MKQSASRGTVERRFMFGVEKVLDEPGGIPPV